MIATKGLKVVDSAPLATDRERRAVRKGNTSRCIACGSRCYAGLNLGTAPAAKPLLSRGGLLKPATGYPLRLVHCRDCGLTQAGFVLPPSVLKKWAPDAGAKAAAHGADLVLDRGALTFAAHPAALIRDVAARLKPTGVLVIEEPYWFRILGYARMPLFNHRQLQFWALRPLSRLFAACGLTLFNGECNGEWLTVSACHPGARDRQDRLVALASEEVEARLYEPATVLRWAETVDQRRRQLQERVWTLVLAKRKIVGIGTHGAATLCSYARLGPELIDYVADADSLTAGRYLPGTQIPILAEEQLFTDPRPADAAIVFDGDAEDETVGRWRENGWKGEVILP